MTACTAASAAAVAASVAAFSATLCMWAALALAAPRTERLVFRAADLFDDLFLATRTSLSDFPKKDQDQ